MKQIGTYFLLLLFWACTAPNVEQQAKAKERTISTIQLAETCPPGFELNENNECVHRSLYQQYESMKDKGVGGLKTALPKIRDKFSPQQIDLGRYLFFDPILSKDGMISCATCHQPNKGFADGLAQSIGIDGQKTQRSSPSLWNVAFLQKLFWDAKAKSLEEQLLGPLYSSNEMGNTPENLYQTINSFSTYQQLFKDAFPQKKDSIITLDEIYTALVAFESSLISLNSRYDQYAHGHHQALNAQEIKGMNVFRSFVARCAECHTPPLFTNQQIAVIGAPELKGEAFDKGAEIPTQDTTLRGGFKVPSLRNIALTAPYNHNGVFNTLQETVGFYTQGRGHAVPDSVKLILHWHIWEPQLSAQEIEDISAFLESLTDESFMPKIPEILPSGIKLN